jgi:ferredoxin
VVVAGDAEARLEVLELGVATGAAGTTMLELCDAHGLEMETECGGFAACNSCRVRVLSGAEHLSPVAEEELPFLDRDDQRLGCQAQVLGPVRVRLDPGM